MGTVGANEQPSDFKPDNVNEQLAGSQWIQIMLAVCAALPIVVRIAMLFMGWTPMVDPTHAICIIATYIVCIGYPVGAIVCTHAKESMITVFKNALYKGIIINSLIITNVRLYLSNADQDNIFSNDLFQQHQLPRWVYAICIMSVVFSTWFKFKPALWLNAAQVGVPGLCNVV